MAPAGALCLPTPFLSLYCTFILLTLPLMFLLPNTIAQSINKSEADRQTLLSFKSGIINDPNGVMHSWRNGSSDFCHWRGVTCGTTLPLRVVSLNLSSAQLTGVLSPSVANLSSLARIDLAHNNLSGKIPADLFNSSSELVVVDLQNNLLTGLIPDFYKMPALQILDLSSNDLSGMIPSSLGNVSSLIYISLSMNNLAGSIPESLSNIQNLSVLSLGYNRLAGHVSGKLCNISSLISIDLAQNNLIGEIPSSIGNTIPNLEMLSMSGNKFEGLIPSSLANASKLQILDLSSNNLSGMIPSSLGNVSSLIYISLSMNNLAGSIPESLSNIQNLSVLSLGYNRLAGHVSVKVYNISSLISIDLAQNNLIGRIPSSIGNTLPNLERLSMSGNKLGGLISSSLANASKLQQVDLGYNLLVGPVPSLGSLSDLKVLYLESNILEAEGWEFLVSLTNCSQLQILALSGNALNGSIPRSVSNLSSILQRLDLGNNQIIGTIPIEIGNLQNLQMLAVDQNFLSGVIPSVIWNLRQLVVLNLSGNRFSGVIPATVGNLSLLNKLYLDNNKLSGNIPASLGNCNQLVMLNLSFNSLQGSIPSQLVNITSLSMGLDLSNNNLTGSIPQPIGALVHLAHLDISFNKLSGEVPFSLGQCVELFSLRLNNNMLNGSIPQSISSLQSMEQLDLSNNYFQGPIPVGGIFQNNSAVILDGNPGLCAIAAPTLFGFPICPITSPVENKKNVHLFVKVIPPIIIVFLFFICFIVTHRKRRQADVTPCYKDTMKKVSYGDIIKATNWFSPVNKISSSRTGSIYIGRFQFDTDLVAIKLFHLQENGAYNSFLTECKVLRNTHHRNIVKAVTVCSTLDLETNEFKAIIYEFMANGSLDMWVHPKKHQNSPKRVLSLGQRIRIAMDVVSALDYMHNQLTPPLIHCDLKPDNVLLDYDMTARVGDFGSARFLAVSPGSLEGLVSVGGTIGYIAPEYGMGYKVSTGSGCDVYGFGVLLLEMLTGKRPTDAMFTDSLSLHKFVSSAFPDRLGEALDPYMFREEQRKCAAVLRQSCVIPLVEVGLLCSMDAPKDRPGIQEVSARILSIKEAFFEGDLTYSPTLS